MTTDADVNAAKVATLNTTTELFMALTALARTVLEQMKADKAKVGR